MAMAGVPTETELLDDVFVDQPQLIGEMTSSSPTAFDDAGDDESTLNTNYGPTLDLNALLFNDEGTLVPNASEIVIDAFLNLAQPKMDVGVAEFLENGHLEEFLSRITRLTVTESPSWVSVSDDWSTLLLSPRNFNEQDPEWTPSLKAVKFLCSDVPENREWVSAHRRDILVFLLRLFQDNAQGNFRHFRQIFVLFVQRFPDMCDVMLQDICPILSQPYVAHLLRHIYDPNVSDCVLALIYRYVGTEPRELRQERFYQLAGMEFMDRLFGMLDETLVKVPSESLLGIGVTQDGSNYELKLCVQALSELIVRIVRESASTPDGHILFINFMGSPPHALSEFIERVIQGQKLGLDVLHTMITAKETKNGLAYEGWQPIPEPKQTSIYLLRPKLATFCEHHFINQPKPSVKLQILEVLLSIMTFTKDADDIAIVCQGIPWKALATGFFVQHVNNSIFHSRFSSLLLHVFDYGSQETLVKVLKESKLVEGFIEHVRGKHANHGHILLICDQLRQLLEREPDSLGAKFVSQFNSWKALQVSVAEELKRQTDSPLPPPPPKSVVTVHVP